MALALGNTAPAAGTTGIAGADSIVAAAGYVDMPATNYDGTVSVGSDGAVEFYLYQINSSRVVTAVHGPFYARPWLGMRNPLRRGMAANLLHLTVVEGTEVVVTPGRA